MEIRKEAILLALIFSCSGETFGNTVVQSPVNPVGDVNGELELVCQLTPFPNATLGTVNWYLNTNLVSMQRFTSDCTEYTTGSGYDQNLYRFTCSGNIFKMKILRLLSSYNGNCWSCSVSFTNAAETAKATACITVRELPTSIMPQTTISTHSDDTTLIKNPDDKKEGLTWIQKIGIGVGCGVGCLIILFVAVIIYWRNRNSTGASSTQDHHNSPVEVHQLQQQSENKQK